MQPALIGDARCTRFQFSKSGWSRT